MTSDKTYQLLVAKMHEVTIIPTQTVGPLTDVYKKIVPFFKIYPWKSTAVLALTVSVILYLLFGPALVKLASTLQFGF